MAEYDAVGGTVTTPYGATLSIHGGRVARRRKNMRDVTRPTDGGNTRFKGGNYVHMASLRGTYAEGSTRIGEGTDGSASVQLGNGATWSGSIVIEEEQIEPNWAGGGAIPVLFSFRWTGDVTKSGG